MQLFGKWIRPLRRLWKVLSWVWGALIIGGLLNILSSWVTTRTPLQWIAGHWGLLLVLAAALLVLTALSYLASAQETTHAPTTTRPVHSPAEGQQNRERMRQHLARWYQEFLDASLMQAAWLDLELADKPDAIYTPVSLVFRDARFSERPLPAGTSIVEVYEQAHRELLILGEPGAGKSTLLYQLAQYLLSQIDTNPTAPLPMIFALSTWAPQRVPLEQWMTEQLVQTYRVPHRLAQHWITNQEILPLFDGLDEMEADARPRCIAALNTYHQAHPAPLVVCSRSAEYATVAQRERLALQRAVVVRPLMESQIVAILAQGGKQLSGLRAEYKQNLALQELLASPLLLNLFLLIFRGTTVRSLPTTADALRQQVLAQYVQRMMARKGRYPAQQTSRWLGWLAHQMQTHHLTQFALEDLQPDWLAGPQHRRYLWSMRLVTGLLFGPLSGLLSGLLFGPVVGLVTGLVVGLVVGPVGEPILKPMGLTLINQTLTIRLAERLHWSWSTTPSRLAFGPVAGLVFGLVFGLLFGLVVGLAFGLAFGLLVGLFFGLYNGFQPLPMIERDALAPGEGVNRSLKNGLVPGLLVGLLFGLVSGLLVGLLFGLVTGLLFGLAFGLVGGLVVGAPTGLNACLFHLFLRFWLWQAETFPFPSLPFLNDACSRHFLKRIGGSYQFMHRLLLEYFASQD